MNKMKNRLHTGALYLPGDEEIMAEFAEISDGCYIEPPLPTNFGGGYVHFGKE